MVEAGSPLVEGFRTMWIVKLVQADERPSREPDDMVERPGILIDDRLGAEQTLIPGAAAAKIADRQRHMSDRRKFRHRGLHCAETSPIASRILGDIKSMQ